MYEKLDQCPVCKNKQFDNHMICDDHSVTGESFALVKCRNCELVFTNPRPQENRLPLYYESNQYISHTDKANSVINLLYKLVRKYTLSSKVKLLNELSKKKGSILDYGCGTGDFVKAAQRSGWQAFGYEPDDKARNIAIDKNDTAISDTLKNIPDNLDIITTWHVIEHVADLKPTLKALSKKLKEGGYLIIAVPNYQSYDAIYYKEFWAAYDVPRHLYHFNQNAMRFLSEKLKLKRIKTLPMKFDSFYVSMLSEKYLNRGNLFKALQVGYKSNALAKKTSEYSSLIYILKK